MGPPYVGLHCLPRHKTEADCCNAVVCATPILGINHGNILLNITKYGRSHTSFPCGREISLNSWHLDGVLVLILRNLFSLSGTWPPDLALSRPTFWPPQNPKFSSICAAIALDLRVDLPSDCDFGLPIGSFPLFLNSTRRDGLR